MVQTTSLLRLLRPVEFKEEEEDEPYTPLSGMEYFVDKHQQVLIKRS